MLELFDFNVFRGRTGLPIVQNVNITCEKSQVVAICGANGSGKSTLLEALAGGENLFIESSTARLFEAHLSLVAAHEIAYLPQSQRFVPYDLVSTFHSFSKAVDSLAINHFDVEALLNRRIGSLSMGQWKRVQLHSHFAKPCKLRLLDEPETALDSAGLKSLMRSIYQARQNSEIILVISHHFSFLKCVADQILILEEGKPAWHSDFNDFLKFGACDLLNPLAEIS